MAPAKNQKNSSEKDKIYFFNLANSHIELARSGQLIDLDELIEIKRSRNQKVFDEADLLPRLRDFSFDPSGTRQSSRWERAVATVVYCIADSVPDRRILVQGRQLLHHMDRSLKQEIGRQIALSFVPYLLVGFNLKLESGYSPNSNEMANALAVVHHLHNRRSASVRSYLCAHREATARKPLALVDTVVVDKARRALHLVLGLVSNGRNSAAQIDWHQQRGTSRASSNMFPEVFLNYFFSHRIPDLLVSLETHWDQIESLLADIHSPEIVVSQAVGLDDYSRQVEQELDNLFGDRWRHGEVRARTKQAELLLKIATHNALPLVKRLMPFYSRELPSPIAIAEASKANLARAIEVSSRIEFPTRLGKLEDITARSIDWFWHSQTAHILGRALFEVTFYYLWGHQTQKASSIGIVIERDYAQHHYLSWKLGYQFDHSAVIPSDQGFPFLAPRGVDSDVSEGVRDFPPFRQFWRAD